LVPRALAFFCLAIDLFNHDRFPSIRISLILHQSLEAVPYGLGGCAVRAPVRIKQLEFCCLTVEIRRTGQGLFKHTAAGHESTNKPINYDKNYKEDKCYAQSDCNRCPIFSVHSCSSTRFWKWLSAPQTNRDRLARRRRCC